MPKGLVLLLYALLALSCPAQTASLPSWNARAQDAWWAQNPTPHEWPAATQALLAQLTAAYRQNGANSYTNSDFQGWMEHLEWIQLGLQCPEVLTKDDNLKTFIALGKDEAVSHLLVRKIDPRDFKAVALADLLEIGSASPADLHEYAALGVAFSLVFDQPFPEGFPHHQVSPEAIPTGDLDVAQRFNFYVKANRDKKLEQDVATLSFDALKYMVDSDVKLSELDYAQQNRISYSHFEDAFFSINYNTTRTGNSGFDFNWDQPTYGLQDIEEHGGICVDQAYYASLLGKGRGIPTLYFHGQGTAGGHAWFGYMGRSGKWNLDCGRYESQNYPKGYAIDPQTWKVIDDTQLTNFFKTVERNPSYQPASNAIAWSRLQDNDASAKKNLDEARAIMPELAETWELEAGLLEKTHASDSDKKDFYQSWVTQFQTFTDMKVEGQRLLLQVLKKSGDPAAADIEQSLVLQNRSQGIDAGIAGAAGPIFDLISTGDWDGARLKYERTIRDFGEQGGGTLYYEIVSRYISKCIKEGQVKQADQAVHFTEERMPLESSSVIGTDFIRLKGEVNDLKSAAPAP